jgi:hypothetical protein
MGTPGPNQDFPASFSGGLSESFTAVAVHTNLVTNEYPLGSPYYGSIVAVGNSITLSGEEVSLIVRYTSAGVLDTSFGGGKGYLLGTPSGFTGGTFTAVTSVAIDSQDRIVIAGFGSDSALTPGFGSNQLPFVARYLPDGTIDRNFGPLPPNTPSTQLGASTGYIVELGSSGTGLSAKVSAKTEFDAFRSVAIGAGDSVIVAGSTGISTYVNSTSFKLTGKSVVARYISNGAQDGQPDPAFGTNGIFIKNRYDGSSTFEEYQSVAILSASSDTTAAGFVASAGPWVLLAGDTVRGTNTCGTSCSGTSQTALLAMVQNSGTLATHFNSGGYSFGAGQTSAPQAFSSGGYDTYFSVATNGTAIYASGFTGNFPGNGTTGVLLAAFSLAGSFLNSVVQPALDTYDCDGDTCTSDAANGLVAIPGGGSVVWGGSTTYDSGSLAVALSNNPLTGGTSLQDFTNATVFKNDNGAGFGGSGYEYLLNIAYAAIPGVYANGSTLETIDGYVVGVGTAQVPSPTGTANRYTTLIVRYDPVNNTTF